MQPELRDYLERIEDLRGQVRMLIADLPVVALNWRPVEGDDDHVTNSLAVMAVHVAGAEHFWIGEVVGGLPATRDRDREFLLEVDSVEPLLARLEEVAAETRTVFASLKIADLDKIIDVRGHEATYRWGILHVIEHTALHLGHMQITYQLWNRGIGANPPRWYQRLPKRE